MATKKTTTKKAKTAGQKHATTGGKAKLPCKVLTNGVLYAGAHHRLHKQMAIPEEDARKLEELGHVAVLPGLA